MQWLICTDLIGQYGIQAISQALLWVYLWSVSECIEI